jgi:hypothetical protein
VLLRPQRKGSLRIEGATITGTDDYHGGRVTLELGDRPNKAWGSSPDLVSPWSRYAPKPTSDSK